MTYTDENRGSIQFRERRKQLVDYSGLCIGNITPTDCDGYIEYHNKAFIYFEIKFRDAEVSKGQCKSFTRNVDALKQANKQAIFIIVEHEVNDPAKDIDAAVCKVRKFYDGKWKVSKSAETLKELIDRFIKYVDEEQ